MENEAGLDVETLYRKYGPMVLRRCRSMLRDEEAALDALQETFVRVIRGRLRLTDRAPSSLLYCIATNVCLNALRSARSRPSDSDEEVLLSIASCENVEELAIARRALDAIFHRETPSTRTMAVLHYVDGMTFEEVAAETGMSVSGVRKRLASLKTRLRIAEGEEA
jgi:RNA polymerase sigma-70 factor (ECF subfamily)